ncbi:NUDIX domain-containing protein [Methylocaldum sp. MU1018]
MSERILVVPRAAWPPLPETGARRLSDRPCPGEWAWRPRSEAETDERFLQIIPYALLRNRSGDIWCYARTGGDARLRDRLSAGVGGHVDEADTAESIGAMAERALRRELREELQLRSELVVPEPAAWIYEGLSAVGRVHIGLLYVLSWREEEPPQPVDGQGLNSIGFVPAERIADDPRFELWSRLAAGFLIRNSA